MVPSWTSLQQRTDMESERHRPPRAPAGGGPLAKLLTDSDRAFWHLVIRPDSRLWSFRLSGGMSVSTFMRTLAPPEPKPEE
jgi:hypothetical protein